MLKLLHILFHLHIYELGSMKQRVQIWYVSEMNKNVP